MERDDITVISQGLADAINPSLYSNDYIKGVIGSIDHHKVRRFTRQRQIVEAGWHTMKFEDYFDYKTTLALPSKTVMEKKQP